MCVRNSNRSSCDFWMMLSALTMLLHILHPARNQTGLILKNGHFWCFFRSASVVPEKSIIFCMQNGGLFVHVYLTEMTVHFWANTIRYSESIVINMCKAIKVAHRWTKKEPFVCVCVCVHKLHLKEYYFVSKSIETYHKPFSQNSWVRA